MQNKSKAELQLLVEKLHSTFETLMPQNKQLRK